MGRSGLFCFNRIPAWLSLSVCLALAAAVYLPVLTFSVSDFHLHVKPWLEYLRANGGFAALGDNFSEYAPPYLYLLAGANALNLPVGDQTLVKLINTPFVAFAAFLVFSLCRKLGKSFNYSVAAGATLLLLPSLGVNAFVWGQADTIYTPFLLCSVVLCLSSRPYWAMAAFAAALSIKLQGIFLAPFIGFMVLAGRIPWTAGFVAPVVYALSLTPAFMLGRPLVELLTVYIVQGKFYAKLSMNAPNPYFLMDYLFGASRYWAVYKSTTVAGLGFASMVGGAVTTSGLGQKSLTDRAIFLIATLSMTVMPYVIPKMHDRFFFGADLFAFALAWIDPRYWLVAVCIQAGSLLSYTPEFSLFILPGEPENWNWAVSMGAIMNGIAIGLLVRAVHREMGHFVDLKRLRRGFKLAGPAVGREPARANVAQSCAVSGHKIRNEQTQRDKEVREGVTVK